MTDTIIKGSGNSRSIKFPPNAASMYQDLTDFLNKGATEGIPIDLGPLNPTGLNVRGTDLNKATLLKDTTAAALPNMPENPTVNNAFVGIINYLAHVTGIQQFLPVSMPGGTQWKGLAYGAGKFVAVGSGINAAYSTDGIHWNTTNMTVNSSWGRVIYGGGKFVAISESAGGNVAYSNDGINWTVVASGVAPNNAWSDIAYGNGKFVAICNTNICPYSTDGITWHASQYPNTNGGSSIAFGNGKFLASLSGTNTAYSTDGINWTLANKPDSFPNSIAYGAGKFVMIPLRTTSSKTGYYSTDGISWTSFSLPQYYYQRIQYSDGKFVIPGSTMSYSSDGINWTSVAVSNATWTDGIYGKGICILVNSGGGAIYSDILGFSLSPIQNDAYTANDLLAALLGTRSTK